jgi:hypothetical protein
LCLRHLNHVHRLDNFVPELVHLGFATLLMLPNLQQCIIELLKLRLISMVFFFDDIVPPISHLPDFRPLFWIGSISSVAILTKRCSIIDVIATTHRLRDDVVNINANLATSATLEGRHLFYLVLQALRKRHFEWLGSLELSWAIMPARNCIGTLFLQQNSNRQATPKGRQRHDSS